jgi:hypothetical protein
LANRVPEGGTQVVDASAQLSDELTTKLTAASQRAGSVGVTIFAGHVITGFSRSCTVTVKLQRFVLPLESVATHVTVVKPTAKRVPEAGEQTRVAPAQLSEEVTANVTLASQRPSSVEVTMFAGQVITGSSLSVTATVKLHRLVLPLASVATQVTTLAPTGKRVPEAGEQTSVGAPQLSETTGENETSASHRPAALLVKTFAGHVITGGSRSWTMTRKAHAEVFPLASAAVQFTVFVPLAKVLPDGGAHVTGTASQLSVAVTLNVATASHRPVAVFRVRSAGHEMTGSSLSLTVTVNEQVCSFPLLSRAVQATEVVPLPNLVPEGGAQVVDARAQLSDEVTENVTCASQRPGSVEVEIFAGQVITGFSRSCTVTVKLQRLVLPLASVATQVTVVKPTAKRVPEAGAQTTVAPAQLSAKVAANATTASHRPGSAATI